MPAAKTDLVSISEIDPTIEVVLGLASAENPLGIKAYRGQHAYLRRGTAVKVAAVQSDLREKGLGLRIWAAYRPFVVQVEMFRAAGENPNHISDPYRPSGKKTHVRAVAVDCTLVDEEGTELPMPTPYLDFKNGAEKMKHRYSDLPEEVLANRQTLKEAMSARGMEPYSGEWWHYQDTDWADYDVIKVGEFPEIHKILLVEELYSRHMALKNE
jgi:D-alanyl-D-alanine dipeptidase